MEYYNIKNYRKNKKLFKQIRSGELNQSILYYINEARTFPKDFSRHLMINDDVSPQITKLSLFFKYSSPQIPPLQSNKILENHPDKVPVILERDKNCSLNKPIKTKYILSKEVTMAEFIKIIREKLDLSPEKALFFLVNGKSSLSGNESLGTIYKDYKSKDGFLYIAYASEEIWG